MNVVDLLLIWFMLAIVVIVVIALLTKPDNKLVQSNDTTPILTNVCIINDVPQIIDAGPEMAYNKLFISYINTDGDIQAIYRDGRTEILAKADLCPF